MSSAVVSGLKTKCRSPGNAPTPARIAIAPLIAASQGSSRFRVNAVSIESAPIVTGETPFWASFLLL
jgi:hypothetical protein